MLTPPEKRNDFAGEPQLPFDSLHDGPRPARAAHLTLNGMKALTPETTLEKVMWRTTLALIAAAAIGGGMHSAGLTWEEVGERVSDSLGIGADDFKK